MSRPENGLAKYRTYSYHQYLIVCSDTETAEAVGQVDIDALQHNKNDSRYSIHSLRQTGGTYVTIIDGTSDAHLNIKKASWSTLMSSGGTINGERVLGPGVDGVIDIYEPNGAAFIGILGNTARTMGISQPAMSFVLKTIFIGETHEGIQEYITNIRPFIFTIYNMSAVFSSTGAQYRLQIIGQVGSGASSSGQAVVSGNSLTVASGETVVTAFKKLEDIANKVVKQSVESVESKGINTSVDIVPPQYRVVASNEIAGFVVGNNTSNSQKGGGEESTMNMARAKKATMSSAIENIMVSSVDIMQKVKASRETGGIEDRAIFYITQTTTTNAGGVTIHTYYVGLKTVNTAIIGANTSSAVADFELDYLFTGKNTDILNLSLKLTNAINVLLLMNTSNSIPNAISSRTGVAAETIISTHGAQLSGSTEVAPVTVEVGGSFDEYPYNNADYPITTANFFNLLSNQAQIDSIGSLIVISGNPALLNETTIMPSQVSSAMDNSPPVGGSTDPVKRNWLTSSTKVRLNVKFPSNPNDLSAGFDDFWYRGLYTLQSIQHDFVDGKFTQSLKILSIANSNGAYDVGEISGGSPASARRTARFNDTSGRALARGAEGAIVIGDKTKAASFTVIQDLVFKVAAEEGVDPYLVLGVIRQESSFRQYITGPHTRFGKARGLMQLLPTTAEDMGVPRALLYNAEDNIRAGTRYLKFLLNRYNGNIVLTLAAYNAGLGTVGLPGTVPNFPETINYVEKIPRHMAQFRNGTAIEQRNAAKVAATQIEQQEAQKRIEDAGATPVSHIKEVTKPV